MSIFKSTKIGNGALTAMSVISWIQYSLW